MSKGTADQRKNRTKIIIGIGVILFATTLFNIGYIGNFAIPLLILASLLIIIGAYKNRKNSKEQNQTTNK